MKKYIIIAISFISLVSYSQNKSQKKEIINSYNQEQIIKLREKLINQNDKKKKLINKFIEINPDVVFIKKEGKTIYQIINIIDNKPVYVSTNNINSAKGTTTTALHSGGSLGLNIEGQNMQIGVWDGGYALKSHVEFTNNGNSESRVITPDAFSSNPPTQFHGTHVAGTIGAQGVNSSAKGMAPQANILSYNWDNDETEVIDAASQNALLISNHSYGTPIYNDNDEMNVPVWYMGCYNDVAKDWDEVLVNMPYYLMVASAGNNGQDSYSGGISPGYDKLTGNKNSKNNLVVANADVQTNVITGAFESMSINLSSSQGPTDDGRIKPDIAGDGTNLLSTSNENNSDYEISSGTSMSSPNVAGSLLLLQQYYEFLNGEYMKSSTLKGLVCHTARDDSKIGPDPVFGWGLLNTRKAANIILENSNTSTQNITEITLDNNENYIMNVSTDNPNNLQATICWTDPSGTDMSTSLNSETPVLVNDLDLRIYDQDSNEYYPWKLNVNSVNSPATKGDNIVDNIEKVDMNNTNTNSTEFVIEVSHKGSLSGGSQNFSLIISGITSSSVSTDDFKQNEISFWPNPVKSNLNISGNDYGFSEDVNAEVYDMTGRMVKSFNNFDNTNNLSLDLNSLSQGIYIVKLNDGRKSIKKRIIKE